jgi:3-oxoacyl-[acyl-carrier-protein] synthase-3
MESYIKAIEYFLPSNVLSNDNINEQFPEWSADKISAKTGIYSRCIANENQTTSDLCFEVGEKFFKNNTEIKREDIDFLIVCTQTPDYLLPTTACLVQHRLGLSQNVAAFDINQGCSGYVYSLTVAKAIIESGIAKNVLLITADTYTKLLHPEDKSVRTIFGDGASCTLISHQGQLKLNQSVLGTDGAGEKNLILNAGLKNTQLSLNKKAVEELKEERQDGFLYMNGNEIFVFTLQKVPSLIADVLLKNNLQQEEIDYFVFHQANKFMLDQLRKKININSEKFIVVLEETGNTVSSSIPIALSKMKENGLDIENKKIMIVGFGVGYSWGAMILNN